MKNLSNSSKRQIAQTESQVNELSFENRNLKAELKRANFDIDTLKQEKSDLELNIKTLTNTNRPLIIFPQGTRVLPSERPPFKKGAARIYENLKIVCQPVAINSGYVWPKKGSKNIDKTITISILNHIEVGIPKDDFLRILENSIYSELDILN